EIIIDRGEGYRCQAPQCALGVCDCDRWLELWNLVFMQFNRSADGSMTPLPRPSIDTGMGLERITSVMQQVDSNFDTDLLKKLIVFLEGITGRTYYRDQRGFPFRVIADHSRACTFLISDGVLPSNEGRGYVLRRILRRAVRFGKALGMEKPFLYQMVPVVGELMGNAYPEVRQRCDFVQRVIRMEEERFHETLHEGMRVVNEIIDKVKQEGRRQIQGAEAFVLYDTFGFPLDLTEDIAEEHGLTVDREGFNSAMEAQRRRARSARSEEKGYDVQMQLAAVLEGLPASRFTGYDTTRAAGKVLAVVKDERVESLVTGEEGYLLLDETPFYGESGGQVGDTGYLMGDEAYLTVTDTLKLPDGKVVHAVRLESGSVKVGDALTGQVDETRRGHIMRNHSATHLLHRALKETLGEHVNQAGSLVAPERLRFDFSHFSALTAEEVQQVEDKVNQQILNDLTVEAELTSLEQAQQEGAVALFGEKYGEVVRLVRMGEYSRELCGGTHVKHTSAIGMFKIAAETAVGAGLRRIEALTGKGALDYVKERLEQLDQACAAARSGPAELTRRIESLQQSLRDKEKEVASLKSRLARQEINDFIAKVKEVEGIKVLATAVEASDTEEIRQIGDILRDRLNSGVIILGTAWPEKVGLLVMVTKDLVASGLHAGNIIKPVAAVVGGSGGGRPEMAQAGGREPARLGEALDKGMQVVERAIKGKK
ncbi:MAG: alanine--tRNA ligase, partial [Syntrophomonadaceae bacterium]|nr:alanine--tRNA ligase [Syntrophomonadaceae bacterium]